MTTSQVETMAIKTEVSGTAALLDEITELAISIDYLFAKIEKYGDANSASVDAAITKLAAKFDALYDRAINKGVPLNTQFVTKDQRGKLYELSLTNEGVEYRVA